ncbi:hypothetical protein A8A01_01235 [Ewingella americana]|nr:hypothetical protein A8A01_01235 [Ewingella americana]
MFLRNCSEHIHDIPCQVLVYRRKFGQNFDDYPIPEKDFDKLTPALPLLPVSADYHEYITSRMTLLQSILEEVNAVAALGELPDVEISDRGVKVTPLDKGSDAQWNENSR